MKRFCLNCGKEFERKKHLEARYCSVSCSVIDRNKNNIKQVKVKKQRYCLKCGKELVGQKAKYCSKECSNKKALSDYHKSFTSVKETNAYTTKLCKWCGIEYTDNIYMGKRMFCSKKCGDQYSKLQEHAKKRGLFVANVTFVDIYKRDKGVCKICGQPIDMTLQYKDKFAVTLDHIIPLSKGGKHEPDNVQLAHRTCNSIKGNKTGTPTPH